ncbi:E2/UBC family protein [Arthrobacter sp. RCC_34]|uniref:E2/UBC family protein n=1 Tax=Arthrobacter sp. RCC_34 TaxID=3239230 RepID=UPI003524ACA0
MLDDDDLAKLDAKGLKHEVTVDGSGWTELVIKDYPLPQGFTAQATDLLVRLPPGFPDAAPDMFWVNPEIRLAATGAYAPASEVPEQYLGRIWQRFSRHLAPGTWRPGIDSLETWMAAIAQLLRKDVGL